MAETPPVPLSGQERPRIADRFTVIPAGPEDFRLHSLGFSLAIRSASGDLLSRLLSLLDGQRTVDEILLALDAFDRQSVLDCIESLLKAGVLESTEQPGLLPAAEARRFRSQMAFFSNFVAPAASANETNAASA